MSRKFVASDFAISIFRLERYETSYENLTPFHGKFARTKDELRRISFALLLHNTVISQYWEI